MASNAFATTSVDAAGQLSGGGPAAPPPPARRLYQLLLPERRDIFLILVFAVVAGLLYLATPLAVDVLVNSLAFGASEGVYIQALVVLTLALLAFLVLLGLVRLAQSFVAELIQRRLLVRLTADMVYRLPRVRMSALDQKLGPELVNRFFDMVTVQKVSASLLLDGISLVLGALIGLLILGFYHPFLLLFDLVLIVGVVLVLWGMGRGAVRTAVSESYAKHNLAAWIEQVAMFPYLFKGHGATRMAVRRADGLAHEYLEARRGHYRIVFRQFAGLLAMQAFASAALLGIGGFLVLDAQLTLGQLVAAELIVSTIVANLASMGKHVEMFYDALAAVDKIGFVIDLPVERSGGEDPSVGNEDRGMEIQVDRMQFSYFVDRPIFEGLTFRIEPGERVALVGSPSYGASTLLDVFAGIRNPSQGVIRVDGLDTRNWDLYELRRQVALVRGRDLVAGSVLENVRFGRDQFSRAQVEAALEAVGMLDAVMALPDGLDTHLLVGGRPLSSSQRGRLALARALLGQPRLLLIDEGLHDLHPEECGGLYDLIFDPAQPWTIVVGSRDPELVSRCTRSIDLATHCDGGAS